MLPCVSERFWSDACLNCVFLPAGHLYEVPEELLVTRKGGRRARPHDSMRLNETLLQTLQTSQTVGAQHAKQVGIGSISRGAVHTGAHLKATWTDGRMQPHFKIQVTQQRWRTLPEQAASGTVGQNENGSPQRSADSSFLWERKW